MASAAIVAMLLILLPRADCDSGTPLERYRHNPVYDNQTCSVDALFTHGDLTLLQCAGVCSGDVTCLGVAFNDNPRCCNGCTRSNFEDLDQDVGSSIYHTAFLGSRCDSDRDCAAIANSICTNNICQCGDLDKFDSENVACIPKCEPSWVIFEEHCYLFGMDELPYLDARNACLSQNSHLVQVDSSAENNFLRNKMREITPAPRSGYWNDLFQVTVNGHEIWRTSGDALDPSVATWYGTNPNDYSGPESCTTFGRSYDYKWVDHFCVNDVRTDTDRSHKYFPNNRVVCEKVATWSSTNPNDYGGPESCTIFKRSSGYEWADYYCVNDVRTDSDLSDSVFPNNRAVCEKDQ